MTFDDLKNTWTALGEADPLWAILTNEESEGGGWDLDAFFASGEAEITSVMAEVDSLGLAFQRGRALDFGCGVGRLTRALGARFDEAHGVDIAPTMLDLARRLNEEHPNLVFHLNQQPDLGLFPTDHFDFVYSRIVLQHMAPEYAMRYIEEFVRVVRPGGLVAFQIPSRPGDDGAAVSDLLRPSGVFRAEVIVRGAAAGAGRRGHASDRRARRQHQQHDLGRCRWIRARPRPVRRQPLARPRRQRRADGRRPRRVTRAAGTR